MSTNENPPEASLLGLPAEIRNRIYREILVESRAICFYSLDPRGCALYTTFNKEHAVEPGLLRCCSRIRREARSLFFHENRFIDHIQRGAMEPQLGHWFWVHGHGPAWTNRATGHLGDIGWARAYWDGRLSGRICEEVFGERVDARPIFMKALAIVDKMRVMRWETVEAVLQEFIDAVDYAGREGSSIPE